MANNKYGLSRSSLTEEMKAIIRKRDGFGCVICGSGLYTYEHYDPKFKDAVFHNIHGICLLCFQHQGQTTKGILSKETIALATKNPKCNQKGYANDFFDLEFPITVRLGNISIRAEGNKDHAILVLNGEDVIKVHKCEEEDLFQFSAVFRDRRSNPSMKIEKNEWKASVHNWDIKQIGNKLSVFNEQLDSRIVIRANPPHELIFEEVDIYGKGIKVHFDNNGKLIVRNWIKKLIEIDVEPIQTVNSLNFNFE